MMAEAMASGRSPSKPIPHLDPHVALCRRHEQDHAVVLAFLTDAPSAAKIDAIAFNAVAAKRLHGGHHHLIATGVLVRFKVSRQRPDGVRMQDAGFVHHPAGELRKLRRSDRRDKHDARQHGKR